MCETCKNDLFVLCECDVRETANEMGVENLTPEEMRRIKKGFEWGIEGAEVMKWAIKEIKFEREKAKK